MLPTDANSVHRRRWKPGSVCIICGEKIYSYQRFNWDHLIPMAKGGHRGRSNKFLAHAICNAVKGDQWPFWLRSNEERQRVRNGVSDRTWQALLRAWYGHPD